MPNRRVPDKLKLVKGSYQPCRAQKTMPDGLMPLPGPPRRLTPEVRKVWRELAKSAPHLRAPDQFVFEMLCHLTHQFRTDPKIQAARISLMQKILGSLYMTPMSRVNIPPEPKPNEWDEF